MNIPNSTLAVSPMRMVRILIVDDQPMILKRVRSILAEQTDFEVCGEACDGAKALEEAQRLKPDVVILNVSMPVMNGFAAARLIKTKLPGTGIVILSSEADKHFVAEAKKIGASAYVIKTRADDSLVKAIEDAVIGRDFISFV